MDCLFWSGIGYGLQGNYSSVWAFLSFQFQKTKKERKNANAKWILINLFFFFCWSSLSDDEIMS